PPPFFQELVGNGRQAFAVPVYEDVNGVFESRSRFLDQDVAAHRYRPKLRRIPNSLDADRRAAVHRLGDEREAPSLRLVPAVCPQRADRWEPVRAQPFVGVPLVAADGTALAR